MRNLILSILILCSSYPVFAQRSGIQGKKLIGKLSLTAPVLERGVEGEIEYAAFRRISFTAGYKFGSRHTETDVYSMPAGGKGVKSDVIVNSQTAIFGARVYTNPAYPAPRGRYWYLMVGSGKADIKSSRYQRLADYGDPTQLVNFTVRNARVSFFEIGWGLQTMFKGWLAVDYHLGFSWSDLTAPGVESYLEDMYGLYGGSLAPHNNPPGILSLGINANLKVGILPKRFLKAK